MKIRHSIFHLACALCALLIVADTSRYCDHASDGMFLQGTWEKDTMNIVVPFQNPTEDWTQESSLINPFKGCLPRLFAKDNEAATLSMTIEDIASSRCFQEDRQEKASIFKAYVKTEMFATSKKPHCLLPGNLSLTSMVTCIIVEVQTEYGLVPKDPVFVRYDSDCMKDCFYLDGEVRAEAQVKPSGKKVWNDGDELSVVLVLTPAQAAVFRAEIIAATVVAKDPVTETDLEETRRALIENGTPMGWVSISPGGEGFTMRIFRSSGQSTPKYGITAMVRLIRIDEANRRAEKIDSAQAEAPVALWSTTLDVMPGDEQGEKEAEKHQDDSTLSSVVPFLFGCLAAGLSAALISAILKRVGSHLSGGDGKARHGDTLTNARGQAGKSDSAIAQLGPAEPETSNAHIP
eukprot:2846254-Rhodomonas_salina.1